MVIHPYIIASCTSKLSIGIFLNLSLWVEKENQNHLTDLTFLKTHKLPCSTPKQAYFFLVLSKHYKEHLCQLHHTMGRSSAVTNPQQLVCFNQCLMSKAKDTFHLIYWKQHLHLAPQFFFPYLSIRINVIKHLFTCPFYQTKTAAKKPENIP